MIHKNFHFTSFDEIQREGREVEIKLISFIQNRYNDNDKSSKNVRYNRTDDLTGKRRRKNH